MVLFGRPKTAIPVWASLLSKKQYTAFIAALDSYFQDTLRLDYIIEKGVLIAAKNEYGFERLGLHNLALLCKQNKTGNYREIIGSHFNYMAKALESQKELERVECNFDLVKRQIAVRVYNDDYISSVAKDGFVSKRLAKDLNAVLVYDLPHTVMNIKPERIQGWAKNVDELFEIGLMNVQKNYESRFEEVKFGPKQGTIFACEAEHIFVSNVLLELESHEELIGTGGALVAAPHRSLVLVYPISDMEVVHMVNSLCAVIPQLHSESPGPLTEEMF